MVGEYIFWRPRFSSFLFFFSENKSIADWTPFLFTLFFVSSIFEGSGVLVNIFLMYLGFQSFEPKLNERPEIAHYQDRSLPS